MADAPDPDDEEYDREPTPIEDFAGSISFLLKEAGDMTYVADNLNPVPDFFPPEIEARRTKLREAVRTAITTLREAAYEAIAGKPMTRADMSIYGEMEIKEILASSL